MVIQEMIKKAYPKHAEDFAQLHVAVSSNEEWLNKNRFTEDLSKTPRLAVELNKESRLKVDLVRMNETQKRYEIAAKEYWDIHHLAEYAAKGYLAFEKVQKAIEGLKAPTLKSLSTLRGEVERELSKRDSALKRFERVNATSQFKSTLPAVVKS